MQLYDPCDSSFILHSCSKLRWLIFVSPDKFIIFWYSITIYYHYHILSSSIIFYLSFGDMHISLSTSSSFVSEFFCGGVFETLVVLLAILFPIKLPVACATFCVTLFEAVLSASVADCLAWWRSFWLYLLLTLWLYSYTYF